MLIWTDAISGESRQLSRETLDAELSPSRFVDCLDDELAEYARRSKSARAIAARQGVLQEALRYGSAPDAVLDLLRPASTALVPALIYVHGGFWQQLSRRESAFAAEGFLARGAAFVAVGYTLAPAARLGDIVCQVRAAVAWLRANAVTLGLDPERFVIAGSSAGAHLAAMMLMGGDNALPGDALCGACLASGVYDLAAVRRSYVNEAVGIDDLEEAALSPSRLTPAAHPPVALVFGEHEPDEFKRESRLFALAMRGRGWAIEAFEVAGRHHFDVIADLDRPDTYLGHAALSMLKLGKIYD